MLIRVRWEVIRNLKALPYNFRKNVQPILIGIRVLFSHSISFEYSLMNWYGFHLREALQIIAQSRAWGIFIRDTAYFIVIQWSMTYASLNHNGIYLIPYENASCTGLRNLCIMYIFFLPHVFQPDIFRNIMHSCKSKRTSSFHFMHWFINKT